MIKFTLLIAAIVLQISIIYSQSSQKEFPVLKGSYFGQKPPGTVPEIFMPEVFNMYKYLHGKLLFSPDGKEVFWVITTADKGVDINKRLFLKQKPDGTWTPSCRIVFIDSA